MMLKPLGDRVLIRPEVAPTLTPSGLHLAEHAKPEQMGTVVAVGLMRHPRKEEAESSAEDLELDSGWKYMFPGDSLALKPEDVERCDKLDRIAKLLRDLVRREPLVAVGDTVIFSWAGGQELRIEDDGTRYLIMREEDILAIVEEETV